MQVVGTDGPPARPDASPSILVAVATDPDERARLSRQTDGGTPLLLVGSVEEAMSFLARMSPASPPLHRVPDAPVTAEGADAPDEVDPVAPSSDAHGVVVDPEWRVVTWRGRRVPLSPLELDLLDCLLEDVGHTWSFELLQREVWGNDHQGNRSHLQAVVKRLRRKLADLGAPLQIDSVRGIGLRLRPAGAGELLSDHS